MQDKHADQVFEHLQKIGQGDERSIDQVIPLVYDDLRALAAHYLKNERPDHTLQPTALVHEVYVRLARQRDVDASCRTHFIRIAAQQIRRVLVDHARARGRLKRGGGGVRVTLTDGLAAHGPDFDLIALNDALEKLDTQSEQDRTIVELKFFGGLTEREIADVMGISERSVRRRWSFAKAWLFRELGGDTA